MKKLHSFLIGIIAVFTTSASPLVVEAADTFTFRVGEAEISLLSDEQSERNTAILVGASPEILKEHAPNGVFPMGVNAFVIRTPDHTTLIDAGLGKKIFSSLKTLGIAHEKIDTILLTHMHGDHIGGLLQDGKPAFPKARIYVAQKEYDYWIKDTDSGALPENMRSRFENVRKTMAAYDGQLQLFQPQDLASSNTALIPGIQAIAAYGHTPGHTMFLLESKGEKLLFWGDIAHSMALQMPVPSIAVTYDIAPNEAVAIRKKVLTFVAKHNIPVAGAHIPFPGVGKVSAAGDGYTFVRLVAQ